MWLYPAFEGYNQRKSEKARTLSADEGLPKIFWPTVLGQTEMDHPQIGWEEIVRKDLREIGTSWEGVKRQALNMEECMQVAGCCGEVLVVAVLVQMTVLQQVLQIFT